MKLYHIDRSGHLKENDEINLIKDIEWKIPSFENDCATIFDEYFKEGVSSHGRSYFLDGYNSPSYVMDIIYEYERRLHYPEKLSRYQSLYAFDRESALEFIKTKELNYEFYKIYEIEYEYYERHNMNLIRGWSHFDTILKSRYYWEDREDWDSNRKPIYEYLVKLPVKIKKEVKYQDLMREQEKEDNKNDKSKNIA